MRKALLTGLLFVTVFVNKSFAQAPTLSMDTLVTGLALPMQMVSAGDSSGRFFVVMRAGSVRVYSKTFSFIRTFLSIPNIPTNGERGLLSMAFHPEYKNNGFFYVYYTNADGNLEISRYRVSSNPDSADVASRKILITIPHPGQTNHNGGDLHFDKDGFLYLSTGDGGGSNDPNNNAQNTSSLLGKILRFNVNTSDVAPYYTIPPDNPFGTEVFATGLRNPSAGVLTGLREICGLVMLDRINRKK
jgi:glucose/arabinose dehydrogenase